MSSATMVNVKGQPAEVRFIRVNGRPVARCGRWLKLAVIHDEIWLPDHTLESPETFISGLKEARCTADLFSFGQKLPQTQPKFSYHLNWDNLAVAPTSDFRV